MRHPLKRCAAGVLTLMAVAVLTGCGSLSGGIAKDGSHAANMVWPRAADTNPLHRDGTFPNLDNLRQVQPGLNKNQIIALIGTPHFNEGFAGVHEWNYLFNFRKDGQVVPCQYKILFDDHMLARSFYWQPATCKDFLTPPAAAQPAVDTQTFTLSADALFAFDKWKLSDVTAKGVDELDKLATKLAAPDLHADTVDVTGYTDRLGSNAYNQKLSERRANSVREYLVTHGVPDANVTARGLGEADPVTSCPQMARAALIACLAPNRRVVVKVHGSHQ